ncbi:hypothetical protein CDL12_05540 [Handroanthus impetiginosus]|uniref:Uncharacterized protein n=1 Tax=Handroanthus impetiginosus TaxID=429701 RepID=A0A2G9HWA6_9LAMI|nr:hypothetical protein CDL12_05540 [Handroanthus impetiginosus]
MGRRHHHHDAHTVSSIFRMTGRCISVASYPVLQCFGWDSCRYHLHHHHFY